MRLHLINPAGPQPAGTFLTYSSFTFYLLLPLLIPFFILSTVFPSDHSNTWRNLILSKAFPINSFPTPYMLRTYLILISSLWCYFSSPSCVCFPTWLKSSGTPTHCVLPNFVLSDSVFTPSQWLISSFSSLRTSFLPSFVHSFLILIPSLLPQWYMRGNPERWWKK